MNKKQYVAIDYGSEKIRVAKTTNNIYAPQVLRPNLINAVRVDRTQGVTSVGAAVYEDTQPGISINNISLFDEKLGTGSLPALNAQLEVLYRKLEIERIPPKQANLYETLFSVPIGTDEVAEIAKNRLLEQNFLTPRPISAAKAIFLSYFPDANFQPGTYLIIDCGASHTRIALCGINPSNNQFRSIEEISGSTGGKEIDILLLDHFTNISHGNQINQAEFLYFVHQFKMGLLNQIRRGGLAHIMRSPFTSGPSAFELTLDEFNKITSVYFQSFERAISNFLTDQQLPPSNIIGILLAGGNAQWPGIIGLMERLIGKNKIIIDEYPEYALVKGLPLARAYSFTETAILESQVQQKFEILNPNKIMDAQKQKPLQNGKKQANSFPLWMAILLEFFPGLIGVLGAGWLVGTGTIFGLPWQWNWKTAFFRAPLLIVWPVILVLLVIGFFGASLQFSDFSVLLLFFPLWCGVPLFSSILAYWVAKKRKD